MMDITRSKQIEHLDSVAYSNYKQKLSCSGYDVPDPYSIFDTEWEDSVSKWPRVEYGNLFNYFIKTPGMYTPTNLESYRSLDSFSLYRDGHVQTLLYHHVHKNSPVCLLKAHVIRSQRVTEQAYDVWVAVHKSSGIISAGHCTCMAGQVLYFYDF